MNARIIPQSGPSIPELARVAGDLSDCIDRLRIGSPEWIAAMWFEASCHDRISELADRKAAS
jgi:hypothetical protein